MMKIFREKLEERKLSPAHSQDIVIRASLLISTIWSGLNSGFE